MRIPIGFSREWRLLLVVVTALIAAGCGDTPASRDDSSVLRMGSFKAEVKIVNPWDEGLFPNIMASLIHSKLVEYDPDYRVVPMLAESWELSADGKAVTFHLKHGVQWHDGLPVSSADAVFSFEFYRDLSPWSPCSHFLDRAEALDEHSFTVHFVDSVGCFLLHSWLPIGTIILPAHIWKDVERPREYSGADALTGCGPYRFERYDPAAQTLTLTANPEYFGGRPVLDRLVWRQFKSFDSLLLSMVKGEVDGVMEYYSPFPLSRMAALEGSPVKLLSAPDMGVPVVLFFNQRKFPMNDLRFREAVACAMDYEEIIQIVAAGRGRPPVRGFMPPAYPYFKGGQRELEQDLTRAENLLDQMGLVRGVTGMRTGSDGKPLRFDLLVQGGSRYPHIVQAAELVSRYLKAVGIEAAPAVYDFTLADRKLFGLKDFDICVGRLMPLDVIAGCGTLVLADSPGNMGTCRDPRLLALTDAFYTARDEAHMRETALGLQDYYAEQLPGLALIHGEVYYPCNAERFEGWTVMSEGIANPWTWSSVRPRNR